MTKGGGKNGLFLLLRRRERTVFFLSHPPGSLSPGRASKACPPTPSCFMGYFLTAWAYQLKTAGMTSWGGSISTYTMEEIQEDLGCGHNKAVQLLAELDTGKGCGLIERVKQGQGRPPSSTSSVSPPGRYSHKPRRRKTSHPLEVKSSPNRKCRLPERGRKLY